MKLKSSLQFKTFPKLLKNVKESISLNKTIPCKKMEKRLSFLLLLIFINILHPPDASASSEDEYYEDDDNDKYIYFDEESPNPRSIFDPNENSDEYWVPEDEWYHHWPPKRSDGRPLLPDAEGVKEWEKIAEDAKLRYKELEDEFGFKGDPKARAYPYCVDGKLPKNKKNDRNLENFVPFFTLSQPRNGVPKIANQYGKSTVSHYEDGIDMGPYIQTIRFLRLTSPTPPEGAGDLHFWAHIYIKSRVPLEGLYIQAIGHPNGLPFGQFRNDFDCDLTPLDLEHSPATDFKAPRLKDASTRSNVHIPCKYGHGEGHGAPIPNIFAYGGKEDTTSEEIPSREIFRTHFNWPSSHCNYVFRAQFIILAVKSFLNLEYETFLTPNYILTLDTKDGMPGPIAEEWKSNLRIKCNEDLIQTVEDDSKSATSTKGDTKFTFSKTTSDFPLKVNEEFESCVTKDVGLDDVTMICPPSKLCLNSLHPIENTQSSGGSKSPGNTFNFVSRESSKFFDQFKTDPKYLRTCRPIVCKDPWKTQPKLRRHNDKDDSRFSVEYSEELFGNFSQFFRENNATHGWTMIFSWFILMGIATFTARFMKEAGAINRDLGNGCLGFGFWIWAHMLLMVFAITFMWIGILDAESLRRKSVPCNFLEIYSENPDLKELCRGKKKTIRRHKKIAITAVVLFHLSLIFAWTRPLIVKKLDQIEFFKKIKIKMPKVSFNFRKIFLWSHILLAYFSKLIAVLSVVPFLLPAGAQLCNDLPIWVFIIEVTSICFFVGATVWQIMEDKMLKIRRSHFPFPEAFEPSEVGSLDYWIKVGITIGSCVLHLIFFILVLVSVRFIYYTLDKKNAKLTGQFEVLQGIFSSCKITSTASEVEMSMQRYYYSRNRLGV